MDECDVVVGGMCVRDLGEGCLGQEGKGIESSMWGVSEVL